MMPTFHDDQNKPRHFRLAPLSSVIIFLCFCSVAALPNYAAFARSPLKSQPRYWPEMKSVCSLKDVQDNNEGRSYKDSDLSSKGIVSALTGIVNLFMGKGDDGSDEDAFFGMCLESYTTACRAIFRCF